MDNEMIQEEVTETMSWEVTAEESVPTYVAPQQAPTGIKKLMKKWWFWAIVAVLVVGLIVGISNKSNQSSSSSSSSSSSYVPTVSPYVTMVKTAKNTKYGITYGAAFDRFFTNPRWEYFRASSGEHVVEFKGGFSYSGSPATATIQFVLDLSAGTLEVYHLSINGQGQNQLMLATMVQKVFESY